MEVRLGFKDNQTKLIQFGKELIFGIGSFFLSKGNIANLLFISTSGITESIQETGIIDLEFFIEYGRILISIKNRCKRFKQAIVLDFTYRLLEWNDIR